jgi:hypothetical protein
MVRSLLRLSYFYYESHAAVHAVPRRHRLALRMVNRIEHGRAAKGTSIG